VSATSENLPTETDSVLQAIALSDEAVKRECPGLNCTHPLFALSAGPELRCIRRRLELLSQDLGVLEALATQNKSAGEAAKLVRQAIKRLEEEKELLGRPMQQAIAAARARLELVCHRNPVLWPQHVLLVTAEQMTEGAKSLPVLDRVTAVLELLRAGDDAIPAVLEQLKTAIEKATLIK